MLSSQEDPVKARIVETELALEVVSGFLETSPRDLIPGARSQAEAFVANAPSLWGYERDTERLFLTLDIAVSAIQADPTYGGGYTLAAACMFRMGVRDVDIYDPRTLISAIPWANRAIMVDPDYPAGWETYIEIHCFKGDFKTAEQALGKVYARFGDNDLYARCAFLFFRLQGDHSQAINWGALAWQTEWDAGRLVQTLFALGLLYRDTSQWAKALDCYRVITEKDHSNAWAFHYWAICAAALGDATRAMELNQQAIQLGQLHEFRAYQEDLRKLAGRGKLGASRITTLPPTRTGHTGRVQPPSGRNPASGNTSRLNIPRSGNTTTSGRVVPAPPVAQGRTVPPPPPVPGSGRMLPPQPSDKSASAASSRLTQPPQAAPRPKVVPAPPAAAPKVVAAPPAAGGKVAPAPPTAPGKVAPAPPAVGAKNPNTKQIRLPNGKRPPQ